MENPEQAPLLTDIEAYLAGRAQLVERAYGRSLRTDPSGYRLWWGPGDTPLSGAQIARHATDAARYLTHHGWNPSTSESRGIRDALLHTRRSTDTLCAIERILNLLVATGTRSPANYRTWEAADERFADQVQLLLLDAAVLARRYGPLGAVYPRG